MRNPEQYLFRIERYHTLPRFLIVKRDELSSQRPVEVQLDIGWCSRLGYFIFDGKEILWSEETP